MVLQTFQDYGIVWSNESDSFFSNSWEKRNIYRQTRFLSNQKGNFYIHHVGQQFYVRVNPSKTALHRLIMNPPKGLVIDHMNRNGLDNRRKNLRITTIQANLRNQIRPNNKTGTTGVSIIKYWKGKIGYEANIKVNYKKIYLGFYKKLEDAIRARKKAEKKYYA